MLDLTVRIGGEAGFGIMTTGLFLGKIATRSGYQAFEYAEYPSLIRGGHNVVTVRIGEEKVYSQEEKIDVLVCLNEETYRLHKENLKENGLIILDKEAIKKEKIKEGSYLSVPFTAMIKEKDLSIVMINNLALGVLVELLGADFGILEEMIRENFAKKGEEIIAKNIEAAKLGQEFIKKHYPAGYKLKIPKRDKISPKIYLTGNEMIGLGALVAHCQFFVAYPMTPASNLLHYLAAKSESSGIVVKHAEDEISVINMALGASFAGVRSMVGTSGGGFALMVEAVSLAGITETPIVIMMGQRPGPATGMPTWTEQGDLLFILHSGHGEFPKIILAPGDLMESFRLTVEAFNLADKYQTPVFILTDKYLLEGRQSVEKEEISRYQARLDRGKWLTEAELNKTQPYKRYQITADGISPRVYPGLPHSLHQANSYEHTEDGHTSEEESVRIAQVDKRNRKITTFLSADAKMPQLYGQKEAPLTVISWGSMKAPILSALRGHEAEFNYLHFSYLWPLSAEKLTRLLSGLKSTLLVENNSTAQFGQLLKMATGLEIKNKLLKYSGRPIYPEEVLKKVKELT